MNMHSSSLYGMANSMKNGKIESFFASELDHPFVKETMPYNKHLT